MSMHREDDEVAAAETSERREEQEAQEADAEDFARLDEPVSVPSLKEFFEETPPYQAVRVTSSYRYRTPGTSGSEYVTADVPLVGLRCSSAVCSSRMQFEEEDYPDRVTLSINQDTWVRKYHEFRCRNCSDEASSYLFPVLYRVEDESKLIALKLGQWPAYDEKVSEEVLDLLGSGRHLFLKGRSAENRSLGVGAFTYYRRVLKEQWGRLVRRLRTAAESIDAPPEMLEQLDRAATSWRFEESVDRIREILPERLMIKGHNPLVLLNRLLSPAIHDKSDAECLSLAKSGRALLVAVAKRINQIEVEHEEVEEAVRVALDEGRQSRSRQRTDGESEGA